MFIYLKISNSFVIQIENAPVISIHCTPKFGTAGSHNVSNHPCIQESKHFPASIKSVGSIENFWGSYMVVCKMLFEYCMQVMWNAVFYDSIAEYSSVWRRGKLWFGQPNVMVSASHSIDHGKETENITAKTVSKAYIQFSLCTHYVISLKLIL